MDARFDLEVFADGDVEGVKGWFAFPEKVRDVEHVGSWKLQLISYSIGWVSFREEVRKLT